MSTTFLEEELADGSLFIKWQAISTATFDEIKARLREIIPEARWDSAQKAWLIPKECAFIYFHEIKQRYMEAEPDGEPAPPKEMMILSYKEDGTKLYVGLRDPIGLFFEAGDISIMNRSSNLEERLSWLEENRMVIIASAKLQRGQRADILKEDLLKIYDAQWPHEKIKEMARRELSHRKTMMIRRKGYVYVIENRGLFKIGMTGDLAGRLKNFKTSLPGKVHPIRTRLVDNAGVVETFLHTKFADKRINGEWFALMPEDVAWLREWDGST